jgi:iron complex outermembrane receptor protein
MRPSVFIAGLSASLLCTGTLAQSIEELVVTASHDSRMINVTDATSVSPDIAQLLHDAPGANVTSNGPITGIPQYRGLFGPRIAVALDGSLLAPAGPNWMDPPISYAITAQLEALEVYRGIAPVSVAQETLGGAIEARTRRIAFGDSSAYTVEGRLIGSAQTVNAGYQADADLQMSNDRQRFKLAAMVQQGDDAEFPGGKILPSSYQRERYDLGYGFRVGDHSLQFDYGHNRTGNAGTPALAMDIDYFTGDLYRLGYRYDPAGNFSLSATVYTSDLDHGMTNFHLRTPPGPASRWRQNIADSENAGFKLEAAYTDDSGLWRAGLDGFSAIHNSNIDNPNNPMFFVVNFNDAERDVWGLYLEREQSFSDRLKAQFGVRLNRVNTNAGEVNGTPAMMMPPAQALRDAFNAADRDLSDNTLDLVLKLDYQLTESLSLYAGATQKQRAPSYQERYLWLPLEATAGLADGQLYIGNINLDPERLRSVEFGADVNAGRFSLHPRLYYSRIDDYIQGTPLGAEHPATRMLRMMNIANDTNRADQLQFNNVAAELYGFDMDWRWELGEQLSLSGLFNYVRGKRRDIGDDLYRIAPANATLRLTYASGNWEASVETIAYAAQDQVSETNREQTSPGYSIANIHGSWQLSSRLRLMLGVENLFNREYAPHLGGYNRVANPDIAVGNRLPAQGINAFTRAVYLF